MKQLFISVLACVVSVNLFAQDNTLHQFKISNIPAGGITLKNNWKFHVGDNAEWAKPEFEDNSWENIDPTKDIYDIKQFNESNMGWFRLSFYIDTSLLKESLSLIIDQIGASEIYLNGNKIYGFGEINNKGKDIVPINPVTTPLSVMFSKQSLQVLAVRYGYRKSIPYFIFAGRPNHCFAVTIISTNEAIRNINEADIDYDVLRTGLFFILSVLHFTLFVFYPKKKGNLYFSLFAITALATSILYVLAFRTQHTEKRLYLLWITINLFNLFHLIFLKAFYTIASFKTGIVYRIMLICFIASTLCYFWPYHYGWVLGFIILPNATLLECVRISFLGIRRKQKGALILAFGSIIFLICYSGFYLAEYILPASYLTDTFYDLTYNIGVISLPVATSVFLALDFAITNRSLEIQLAEVQKLSEQTLMQQQEKQQLLSDQNILLEKQVKERTWEITQQKTELQKAFEDLKQMQTQLIQSEKEKMDVQHAKELHELEASALRAQMNPHFIFNCINSIKSLIQDNEQEKAIIYLGTFSKLIRTIFQNSDKREITLFDEIETCQLYTQLESMRVGDKLNYSFVVEKDVDLKSVMIPALIIQPFIENAIWHGIIPKEESGKLIITVYQTSNEVYCKIDDDGIGRMASKNNKSNIEMYRHESKGLHLTKARLDLDNLLNERNGTVKIIDKLDAFYKSLGTTIILSFNKE